MKWYVLYTRHHHERAVDERLLDKGFQSYLPLAIVWRKSNRGLRKVESPLFPRHIFVRCYLEMYAHLALISIPGVMQILEDLQGQLVVVSEDEIRLVRKLCNADVALERTEYPPEGQFVEVVEGQLRGIAGVFREESKTTLLVPIHALQTSVAVEVNRAQVMPYTDGGRVPQLRPSLTGFTVQRE
jgi:transcription antitermination factor NusG